LALAGWKGAPVAVRYRSFFLNADIPAEGVDFRTHMLAKGQGRIPLEQFFAGPREAGAAVGLTFNFEAITRAPNTMLSHRLLALTTETERAAMVRALYDAYFEHGQDVGDLDTLVGVAAAQGLNPDSARTRLLSDAGSAEVLADVAWAKRLGISGVPFFLLDGRYWLNGAQPPDVLLKSLQHALDARRPAA
jgi:predicted DsbA family dithiol-disulfide isomerase